MKDLIAFIEKYVKLNAEAIHLLEQLVDIQNIRKNEHILQAGQYCNKIWFLKSGMVRKYYLHNGKEHTCWLHTENEMFTSLPSYTQQITSNEYFQACEDTELISLSREKSLKLNAEHVFSQFSNMLMQSTLSDVDFYTKEFANRDAKGKYEYLKEIAPEVIKRGKLGHIASILGMSQETLSRIRRK